MITTCLAALVLACSTGRLEDRPSPADAIFPHGADYDTAARHGHDATERGVAACGQCHGVDEGVAPTCESCHPDYPHPDGWRTGKSHGADLVGLDETERNAARAVCDACHASPGLSATEEHGCNSCHGSYPHPAGWAGRGEHGAYALARPDVATLCGPCHGADLLGGDAGVSCLDCHPAWPHPPDWAAKANHGTEALADLDGCAGCHATADDWDGGNAQVACSRCHAAFPHDASWSIDHIITANRIGEAICLRCHQAGDGPDTVPATCGSTCHGSMR